MKKMILIVFILFLNISLFGEEIIKVSLSNGEIIAGRLTLPLNKDNVPSLVIFVHGTGPNTYLNKRKIGNTEFNYLMVHMNKSVKPSSNTQQILA